MLCGDAHIEHYKFRLTKHQCVDALQDEVFFTCAINFFFQGYQKGVVDIAISEFPDINDPALGPELLCSNRNIVQGFPLVLSSVKSDRYSIENHLSGSNLFLRMYNQVQTLIIEAEERSLVSGPATVLLRGLIAPRVQFSVQSL